MAHDDLPTLFDYTAWANARVLDLCEPLPGEQWARDLGNSFPSLRDTMAHVAAAEWIWLQRWRGTSPPDMPTEWRQSTVPQLRARFAEVERDRAEFLEGVDAAALERPHPYRNTSGKAFREPLWQQMRHVVNHSSYHRGQAITMLRQLGVAVVPTDLIVYFRENG